MIKNEITHNKSDEHTLEQASSSLGFFTQNRDILTEIKDYFVNTIKLVIICQEHFFNKIIYELAIKGIGKAYAWYGYSEGRQSFTLEKIKKLYYYENSLL